MTFWKELPHMLSQHRKRLQMDPTKVTDMLYACYDLAENDQDFKVMLRKIKDRYDSIINGLHLKLALDEDVYKRQRLSFSSVR